MVTEIPVDGGRELAIKAGMRVDFSTPLYKKPEESEFRIEITEKLHIHPKDIFTFLVKNVGDSVKKGDVIARKKSFFSQQIIPSEIDGVITEIDHIDGIIVVRSSDGIETENCWFCGEIDTLSKGRIGLKIGQHKQIHAERISDDFGGSAWFYKEEQHALPDMPIAIGESVGMYDIAKLDAVSVHGIITRSKMEFPFPYALVKDWKEIDELKTKKLSYCVTQAHHSTIIFYTV